MNANDPISQKILQELQINGRISNTDLAEKIGLSTSACLRRVRELENAGIIQGYKAIINHKALGISLIAYVTVGLSVHTKKSQEAFEAAMAKAPEVLECHNVSGAVEYILRIETEDLETYKHFYTDVLGTFPHVTAITSYIVMGSSTDKRA